MRRFIDGVMVWIFTGLSFYAMYAFATGKPLDSLVWWGAGCGFYAESKLIAKRLGWES